MTVSGDPPLAVADDIVAPLVHFDLTPTCKVKGSQLVLLVARFQSKVSEVNEDANWDMFEALASRYTPVFVKRSIHSGLEDQKDNDPTYHFLKCPVWCLVVHSKSIRTIDIHGSKLRRCINTSTGDYLDCCFESETTTPECTCVVGQYNVV